MLKNDKVKLVEQIKSTLNNYPITIVARLSGMNAAEVADLRLGLATINASMQVVKNKLAKIAFADLQIGQISDMTALIYGPDIIEVTKLLIALKGRAKKIALSFGFYELSFLSESDLSEISKLASVEQLKSRIITILYSAATRLLSVLMGPGVQIVKILEAYSNNEGN